MNTNSMTALLTAALNNRYQVEVIASSRDRAEVRLSRSDRDQSLIVLDAETWDPGSALELSRAPNHLWVIDFTVSPVAEQLRVRRQSFIDLSRATVYLDLPELLIDRTMNSTNRSATRHSEARTPAISRRMVDPFADRASLLARVLLESPGETWTITGLAEAAGVAPMLSSHIVRQLAADEIVQTAKDGRKLLVQLIAPRQLMEAWTARYDWRRNTVLAVAAPVGDEERFLHRFDESMNKRKWALTLLAGAWRRTAYTPADRLHAYVEVDTNAALKELVRDLGWVADPRGQLVLFRPAYRTSVWHGMQRVKGVPVVSDIQLIIDLWHYPVNGHATAEQMFGRIEERFLRGKPPRSPWAK